MLKDGIISPITFDEGAFVLGFMVIGKRRSEGKGTQGEPSENDLDGEAHVGE